MMGFPSYGYFSENFTFLRNFKCHAFLTMIKREMKVLVIRLHGTEKTNPRVSAILQTLIFIYGYVVIFDVNPFVTLITLNTLHIISYILITYAAGPS